MTHADLCKLGAKWLSSNGGRHILVEPRCKRGENPDVIGLHGRNSVIIECKTSVSDYQADARKHHRDTNGSMGNQRYFLCPPGIADDRLLDGWGLLIALEDGAVELRCDSDLFDSTTAMREAERDLYAQQVKREVFGGEQKEDEWGDARSFMTRQVAREGDPVHAKFISTCLGWDRQRKRDFIRLASKDKIPGIRSTHDGLYYLEDAG